MVMVVVYFTRTICSVTLHQLYENSFGNMKKIRFTIFPKPLNFLNLNLIKDKGCVGPRNSIYRTFTRNETVKVSAFNIQVFDRGGKNFKGVIESVPYQIKVVYERKNNYHFMRQVILMVMVKSVSIQETLSIN